MGATKNGSGHDVNGYMVSHIQSTYMITHVTATTLRSNFFYLTYYYTYVLTVLQLR